MREKELRLALVCYGGISLAVYMHGITKEIWRLSSASRAFADGDPPAPGSQGVYRTLLQDIEDETGIRLRVLIDIIAGASAGGINGVFLAQAITTGQPLEPLTQMWLDNADADALLDPDQAPKSGMTKFWAAPIAWMAAKKGITVDGTVDPEEREEVQAKLLRFVRSRWFEPPFGGKRLLNMILDALDAMAKSPKAKRLLPNGQPLDLFVTVTDFGGHPERLRLNSPPEVVETEHRLVLSFTDHGGTPDTLAHPAELAFAARATSSFPGAFPAFTVGELDAVAKDRKMRWPGRKAFLGRALPRHSSIGRADHAALIDGSVLANAPFRPAIEALRERPAHRQIDRRFVYIDPSPGMTFALRSNGDEAPGFFRTVIGALSELPRHQPIRDNLDALSERSEKIERMLTILERIREEVEAQVESLFGYTLFLDYPTPKRLENWRKRAQNAAAAKAGYGHTAYALLKLDGIVDRIATTLNTIAGKPDHDAWHRMRARVAAAVEARGAHEFSAKSPNTAAIDFLRAHDLGFRIRRLRLLARRLAELDALHGEAELKPMRDAIYDALAAYLECERSDRYRALKPEAKAATEDAGPAIDALEAAMDLRRLDEETDTALSRALSSLDKDLRRPMLLAYLGFPFFDIATLPMLQGEGLDEFDPIRIDRISPDDCNTIRAGGAAATLKGIQFNNFGAFFSRAYRENDYLWGRLHGADRLIDIVISTLPDNTPLKPGAVAAFKRRAFHAILDEEEPRLKTAERLIASLRSEIG